MKLNIFWRWNPDTIFYCNLNPLDPMPPKLYLSCLPCCFARCHWVGSHALFSHDEGCLLGRQTTPGKFRTARRTASHQYRERIFYASILKVFWNTKRTAWVILTHIDVLTCCHLDTCVKNAEFYDFVNITGLCFHWDSSDSVTVLRRYNI